MAKVKRSVKTLESRIWAASPDDDIVISGISGKFPNAKNMAEFSEKLYSKVRKHWPLCDQVFERLMEMKFGD